MKKNQYIEWVNVAKGIGILLVVVGHVSSNDQPAYWGEIRRIIYLFHMPLFFIVSGYLYGNSIKISYFEIIIKKLKRLIIPFFSIAIIFLFIKIVANLIFELKYPVNIESIGMLIVNPVKSYMPLLWFIHALFFIFIIYPLAKSIMNDYLIFLLCTLFCVTYGHGVLIIGNAIRYMPYFVFGVIIGQNLESVFDALKHKWYYVAIIFIVLILLNIIVSAARHSRLLSYAIGISGSSAIILLSSNETLKRNVLGKIFRSLGYYSMSIYLFHTLFESFILNVARQMNLNRLMSFEVVSVIAILTGLLMPVILENMVLRKYRVTRNFILGIDW